MIIRVSRLTQLERKVKSAKWKGELAGRLTSGSRLFNDRSSLQIYSIDQGEVPEMLGKLFIPDSEPDLVLQPGCIDDLVAGVHFAGEKGTAIVPRGAATFGMGGAVPHHG